VLDISAAEEGSPHVLFGCASQPLLFCKLANSNSNFGPYYHLYKHCFQFFFVETSFCPACSLSDNNNVIVIFLMLVRTICLHSYHLVFVGFIPSLIMNRQLTFWLSK
ncbi:unnamed protein product, partial [Musa banksii]